MLAQIFTRQRGSEIISEVDQYFVKTEYGASIYNSNSMIKIMHKY